jgi:hypothetical protein
MKTYRYLPLTLIAAAVLAACSSMPVNNSQLDQARSDYNDAQASPQVTTLAAGELRQAGDSLDKARWHYSFARLGSAELHVELDGREVWKQERTPGVVGRPTDPYWLFMTPAETPLEPKE